MPRKNETATPQKMIDKFIKRNLEGGESVVALAKEYGISRATAYNWLAHHREKVLKQAKQEAMTPADVVASNRLELIAENKRLQLENRKLRNKLFALLIKTGEL